MASLLFKLRVAALVAGRLVVLQRAAAKRVYAPSGTGFAQAAASFVHCRDVLASSGDDGGVQEGGVRGDEASGVVSAATAPMADASAAVGVAMTAPMSAGATAAAAVAPVPARAPYVSPGKLLIAAMSDAQLEALRARVDDEYARLREVRYDAAQADHLRADWLTLPVREQWELDPLMRRECTNPYQRLEGLGITIGRVLQECARRAPVHRRAVRERVWDRYECLSDYALRVSWVCPWL